MAKDQSRAAQAQAAEGHAVALVEFFECLPPETSNRNLLINSAWQMLDVIYKEWNSAEESEKQTTGLIDLLDPSTVFDYKIRVGTIEPTA